MGTTVQAPAVPLQARTGSLWSRCGKPIDNASQAIEHAAECCSVGRVLPGIAATATR